MPPKTPKIFEIFFLKYALTSGITKEGAYEDEEEEEGRFSEGTIHKANKDGFNSLFFKGEYARTEKEAREMLEKMKESKLKSLRKQIAKIEGITFEKALKK